MLLIRPFSDIHTEFWHTSNQVTLNSVIPPLPTDKETVAVIAGDIGIAHVPQTWVTILNMLSRQFLSVVWVMGNHFFYNNKFYDDYINLVNKAKLPMNVHLLENNFVKIKEVLFIGANLWTNFDNKNPLSMMYAQQGMNDFAIVRKKNERVLTPEDTVDTHNISKKYIFKTLKKNKGGVNIVVTHHGISPKSISPHYTNNMLNAAYTTDLTNEILALQDIKLPYWIHGHTHDSIEYQINNTKVIVNPFGYKGRGVNKNFKEDMVLTI